MRKDYLDVAKLFALLGVIHNHSALTYSPIRLTISAFHIPIFFVIYGIAASDMSVRGREWLTFFEKRVRALLVPYVLWALIYGGSKNLAYWKELITGNNWSLGRAGTNQVLWFLPCMFLAVLLYQLFVNIFAVVNGRYQQLALKLTCVVLCGAISRHFNGNSGGGRFFGWDIAFSGVLFMIVGNVARTWLENMRNYMSMSLKLLNGCGGMLITYAIIKLNEPYFEGTGWDRVVMALGIYGRYDLFIAGALAGSFSLLFLSMLFERIKIFSYMGRFSLVIMAVHYILFIYVKPWCNNILSWNHGNVLYPIAVAGCCFILCIPICYIINWACPQLNGKVVK